MRVFIFLRRKWDDFIDKIRHDRGTPDFIARGWAVGVAVNWLLPVGAQMIAALPLAWLCKGSKIGAVAGTCISNPVTIWVLYPLQCYLGNHLLGGRLSYEFIQDALDELLHKQSREALFRLSSEIIVSFFTGGALLALLTVPPTYFLTRHLVRIYQMRHPQQ